MEKQSKTDVPVHTGVPPSSSEVGVDRLAFADQLHKAYVPNSGSTVHASKRRTAIFIQDECLRHRFIRSRDTSGIFERPERLHALKLGLAAAIARIEDAESEALNAKESRIASASVAGTDEGDLAAALARMEIKTSTDSTAHPSPSSLLRTQSVTIRRTSASVSLLDHAAVKYVHGDIERDVYLENLIAWARDSQKNIMEKGTEIPEGIPPLDLYLCPSSIDAIQGAVGAVCEAVDASITATRESRLPTREQDDHCERAFVAIRPPGHHCGEDSPSGFCFVNNVAVGAAHAHLNHGIQRIVILDIDLHHGNGTQSIVWQINEETYRQTIEAESDETPSSEKPGPRIFYGSLHDVLSFPCEDGKPEIVQAASASIHGPHGQYIENVHLQRYDSETHFWDVLYPQYLRLLHRARSFLDQTGGPGDDAMIFISCGFDAGEHEYPSMSRHHRKVPVGFYHRFTQETCKLADEYASGRIVSVLEGGYSDRALTSGAIAHLCGLVDIPDLRTSFESHGWVDPTWWSEGNLVKLEKAVKPRKTASARASMDEWLARTIVLLSVLNGGDTTFKAPSVRNTGVDADAPLTMMLRGRKKPVLEDARSGSALPGLVQGSKNMGRSVSTPAPQSLGYTTHGTSGAHERDPREAISTDGEKKRKPRVILHVRPPDKTS